MPRGGDIRRPEAGKDVDKERALEEASDSPLYARR